MNRDRVINITAAVLLLVGLVTLALPIAFVAARAELYTTTAHALLFLVASWLLYKRQKLTILVLVISAAHYLVGGWYEANAHNISISRLIPAFYWSLALRTLLVVFVFYLLKRPSPNAQC